MSCEIFIYLTPTKLWFNFYLTGLPSFQPVNQPNISKCLCGTNLENKPTVRFRYSLNESLVLHTEYSIQVEIWYDLFDPPYISFIRIMDEVTRMILYLGKS